MEITTCEKCGELTDLQNPLGEWICLECGGVEEV